MITQTIERLINGFENYEGVACGSLDEMVDRLKADQYNILLIGAGFDKATEQELQHIARKIQPQLKIIEHYGGGSGLLLEELNRE